MTAVSEKSNISSQSFLRLCGLLFLVAFALRAFYAFDAKPAAPIRGDINDYVLYAWNLKQAGIFSSSLPGAGPLVPDDYRGPGYPLVLSIAMRLAGDARLGLRPADDGRSEIVADPPTWVGYVLLFQALCGALTVLIAIALAREFLTRTAALIVGMALALWPHLIVFCGTMLSETVFGTLLALGVLLLVKTAQTRRVAVAAATGLTFGAAYLVNPLIALFPVLAALLLFPRVPRRFVTTLLLAYFIAPGIWLARNLTLPASSHGAIRRIEQNFVQGSWPQFLTALATRGRDEISAQIVAAENEEEQAFVADPWQGLRAVRDRMSEDPLYYISWYLAKKPFLLWDWGVRAGWGDIYFLDTPHSSFARVPLLAGVRRMYLWFNAPIFALAALATLRVFWRGVHGGAERMPFAPVALAWIVVYLTAVHVVLQAEPRYAVAYRAFEVLLAVSAGTWLLQLLRPRRASEASVP